MLYRHRARVPDFGPVDGSPLDYPFVDRRERKPLPRTAVSEPYEPTASDWAEYEARAAAQDAIPPQGKSTSVHFLLRTPPGV
jgi:hypothetical protein